MMVRIDWKVLSLVVIVVFVSVMMATPECSAMPEKIVFGSTVSLTGLPLVLVKAAFFD